jgi:hypothetical protein
MEYRGKRYTVVQGIGPASWKWTVYLDDTERSGSAQREKQRGPRRLGLSTKRARNQNLRRPNRKVTQAVN